jgi:DNA invertase Pin-like site-specific DNA recombinase
MAAIVVYRRVSTKEQGNSGLGLDAQQTATEAYAKQTGAKIIGEYIEVETGTSSERPELKRAIAHAKRSKATLVVAKLDRLARNVAFTSALMQSGLNFVCCDNPHANKLTIHILAAMAEHEAEQISERTTKALAAYKANNRVSKRLQRMYPDGVPPAIAEATAGKLGGSLPQCRNLSQEARQRGAQRAGEALRQAANEAYVDLVPEVKGMRDRGLTLREIAAKLNESGHTTRRGKPWNPVQVSRVLERVG